MVLGFLLALPFVLLVMAIMIIFPFQMFMIWWDDVTMNATINHACDWWLNPLWEVTKGHLVMSFLYVILYFVSMISFLIFHVWLCETFKINSPLSRKEY
jgi:hypothetical protein